jgi:hypothetical protein
LAITAISPRRNLRGLSRPERKTEWIVYAKRPFGGPEAVLAYLLRYTHLVAIANSRLIACDQQGVIFKWKDYRIEGRDRYMDKERRMNSSDKFWSSTPPGAHSSAASPLNNSLHRLDQIRQLARGAQISASAAPLSVP